MEKLKEYLPYIIILCLVILIKTFIISTVCVDGESMYKNLHDNDIMILNKIKYNFEEIKRFDIVVIKYKDHYIIKRVIGLPEETVEYKNNTLYINGKKTKDKYNLIEQDDFTQKLGKDEFFVMGDNRGDSLDSRIIGPIEKENIIGNSEFIIYPFNRFGRAK